MPSRPARSFCVMPGASRMACTMTFALSVDMAATASRSWAPSAPPTAK
jgi:hypothetical protein